MEREKFTHSKWKFVVIAALLVLMALGILLLSRGGGQSNIEITAATVDGNTISLTDGFIITGAGDMDLDLLASRLSMEPAIEFTLEKGTQEGQILLRTFLPLDAGVPVSVILSDGDGQEKKRWEFHTEDVFRVLSSFPVDQAGEVPPSSSIEVLLSAKKFAEETLAEYVTVSPDIAVEFTKRNNAIIIAPREQYFPAGTDIVVTVSGKLPREGGGTLGEDYIFSFTTGPEEDRAFRLSSVRERLTENIPTGDDVLLKLQVGEKLENVPLSTTVYRYADSEGYLAALRSYRDSLIRQNYTTNKNSWSSSTNDYWQAETEGLQEVMKFVAPAGTLSEIGINHYVTLPEKLEPGWYCAKVEAELPSGGKRTASKLIQVSPLAVYYAQTSTVDENGSSEMVAWVNSTETGGPVKGADVAISASNLSMSAETGDDGLAMLRGQVTRINRQDDNNEDGRSSQDRYVYGLLTVRDGDNVFYDMYGDGTILFGDKNKSSAYMAYLFSDRPVYRHTDTVRVWGLVKPRVEGTPLPDGLHLSMLEDTLNVPIIPGENGTFQAEFPIEAVSDDYLIMGIRDSNNNPDDEYASMRVEVEDYIKPVYQTAATPEKPVFTAWGDEAGGVGIGFAASYFEGTPAREYKAEARVQEDSDYVPGFSPVPLVTDAGGKARVVLHPNEPTYEGQKDSWRPQKVDYGIFSDEELNVPQVQGDSISYLYRDTMLTMEKGGDGTSVTVRANRIDTSRIKSEADLLVDDNLRGEAVETQLTAEVHKVYFEMIPSGERYDAINKVSATAYESEYTDKVIDTLSAVSSGGSYTFTGLPNDDKYASYYLKVTAPDSRGKTTTESVYYDEVSEDWWRGEQHNYKLVKREPQPLAPLKPGEYYDPKFSDNETLDIYLTDQGEPVPDTGGKLLYLAYQNTILDYKLVDSSSFPLPFDERFIPNYGLCGAYFDGKYIYATNYTEVVYDPVKRELGIEIQPEQDVYAPGDTAAVSFQVTEKATGTPAADTTLVAAVVDEAVFAIEEQIPDFLKRLYNQIYHGGYLMQYTSYDNHETGNGGRGAGGPNAFVPRVDFQDTAAFRVLTTDAAGRAVLDVPLPDNLTSWRVTALAFDGSKAGDTKDNFAVSKDFFVTPVLPPRLLIGDDLVFTVRGAGEKTDPEDMVNYTCTVQGVAESFTAQGKAGDFTPISIPADSLPEGAVYNITIGGECGGKSDALVSTLEVVDSGLQVAVTRQMPLADAAGLTSAAWPVTLGFYDRDHALEAELPAYLSRHEGARVDQRIARRFVMERMRDAGCDPELLDYAVLRDDFAAFCPDRNYYRLFPYAQDSAGLSARVQLAVSEEDYRSYPLEDVALELPHIQNPADRAAHYLMYSDNGDLTWMADSIAEQLKSGSYAFREKMYLVAALARTGERKAAEEWYGKLTEGVYTGKTDASGNPLLSAASADDTAAACIAATTLGYEDADGLVRTLLTDPSRDELYLLEMIYYLRQQPETTGSSTQVSYNVDGESRTDSLKKGFVFRSFSKEQLVGANFKGSGDIWVSARYTSSIEEAFGGDNALLSLTRTVESADGGTLRQGGRAKITLRWQVPDTVALDPKSTLTIQDYVPTGMRFESTDPETKWYLGEQNDQRVTFVATMEEAGALTYYVRCVAPGRYVAESAFLTPAGGSVWGACPRQTVEIQPVQ